MAEPVYESGSGGSMTVNGTALPVISWTRTPKNRKADASNSSVPGWQRPKGTLKGWSGTAKVVFDSDNSPEALGITQNAEVDLVLERGLSGSNPSGKALLDGPADSVDNQNGIVTYDVAWESIGVWTEPT